MYQNEKGETIRQRGWMYFWAFASMFLITLIMFTKQTRVIGDIGVHMQYSLSLDNVVRMQHFGWHFVCWLIFVCLPVTIDQAAVLTTALFNGVTAVIVAWLARKLLDDPHIAWKGKISSYLPAILAFVGMTVGSLYLRFYNNEYYLGQGTPNPWHNPTTIAVRPFMLLVSLITLDYWDLWMEKGFDRPCDPKRCRKYQWILMLLLLLSTLAKPSFLMIYLPVCGIAELWRMRKHWKQGEAWKCAILRNLYYIPTLLLFLWQYITLYMFGGEASGQNGVAIAPFYFAKIHAPSVTVSLLLRMAFPFLVIVIWRKKIFKERLFPMIFGEYLMGLLISWTLTETGNRAGDGNFGWGNALGTWFLWIFCLIYFVKELGQDWERIKKEPRYGIKYLIPGMFLIWHFLAGISYYIYVLNNMSSQL